MADAQVSKTCGALNLMRVRLPPSALTIRTKQGREYSRTLPYPKGAPENPLTIDEVIEKFRKCQPLSAKPLPKANVDQIIKMVVNLEKVPDMTEVVKLLVP